MLCTPDYAAAVHAMTWEFSLNQRERWYWRSVDRDTGLVLQQAGDFATLYACVKDAEHHGYRLPRDSDAWYGIPV